MEVDQKNALYGDSHINKSEGNGPLAYVSDDPRW